MRNRLGAMLLLLGCICIVIAVYQYYAAKIGVRHALEQAEAILDRYHDASDPRGYDSDESGRHIAQLEARRQFQPVDHDVIGVLSIPQMDARLPIIEGTDEKMLSRGVGHYKTTAYPMDNEQILLSGHRDTVFKDFGKLSIGDRLIIEMPYGDFVYEIMETEIVDKDDTTVIGPRGTEVLTLSTCYPFRYIGDAPDRYIIYAYPIKE